MHTILHGLNAAQSSAVTATAPVLQVLAPPGSGKTKTLTARVAYLLAYHGYKPWNVICCTFTIKASREMRSRLKSLIGEALESKLLLGTFHSICYRYLKAYGHLLGKKLPKDFGIADASDCLAILSRTIKRLKVSIDPKPTRTRISRCKARAAGLEDARTQTRSGKAAVDEEEFLQVYDEYQNALTTSNLLDYDDLLVRCAELLRDHPICVSNVEAVLIDEFQDTNTVQLQLMKLFASKHMRVTIVGDPDQSIYGFRSAEIQNLTRMQQFYPDTLVINLEENYRSSAAVLRCAQEVIEQDRDRPDKKLKATHCYGSFPVLRRLPSALDEARWLVAEIRRVKALTGTLTSFSDYAILLRSAHLSLLIENALSKEAMPYRMVGGHRFFDREEIRILLDYLRTISQPSNNTALSAIINVPARKIGAESLKDLRSFADEKEISLWVLIQKITQGNLSLRKKLSRPAEQNLCKLISLIKDARKKMREVPTENTPQFLLGFCIERLRYKEYLQGKHAEDHANRWANVEELIAESGSHGGAASYEQSLPTMEGVEQSQLNGNEETLSRFLANVTLSSDKTEDGQDQECITISTIHSAKGLEWPIVFIPAVYDGSIPHSRAEDTDEERRLLYVAMTRAQALLYLTCPLQQSRSDARASLSSFLPTKLHQYFTTVGPDVTEQVVRDFSLILRRDPPAEEDLIKGMRSLSDEESFKDDLWPVDGSARPKQWWELKRKASSASERPDMNEEKRNAVQAAHDHKQMMPAYGWRNAKPMPSPNTFSAANCSMAFSTAAQQLELRQPASLEFEGKATLREASLRKADSKASLKKEKPQFRTRQGTLERFSGRASQSSGKLAVVEPPRIGSGAAGTSRARVPVPFASHSVSTKPTSLKRPQPLQEVTNAKRREYAFLSSSPSWEPPLEKYPENGSRVNAGEGLGQENGLGTSEVKTPTTLHTTSMDMMQQQNAGRVRKSYGIRRMMNGWQDRKNK